MAHSTEHRIPSTRVLLVRSAATELADGERLRGRSDEGITPPGRAQAAELAHTLRDVPADRLLTSPLLRARETAAAIGVVLGLTPVPDERLMDADTGRWTGMTLPEAKNDDPVAFDRYERFPQAASFPGGESMPHVERRLFRSLTNLRADGVRVGIVVSHELPIRLALARLRADDGAWMWYPPLPPASQSELRIDDDGVSLPTVLEGLFREAAGRVRARWDS